MTSSHCSHIRKTNLVIFTGMTSPYQSNERYLRRAKRQISPFSDSLNPIRSFTQNDSSPRAPRTLRHKGRDMPDNRLSCHSKHLPFRKNTHNRHSYHRLLSSTSSSLPFFPSFPLFNFNIYFIPELEEKRSEYQDQDVLSFRTQTYGQEDTKTSEPEQGLFYQRRRSAPGCLYISHTLHLSDRPFVPYYLRAHERLRLRP